MENTTAMILLVQNAILSEDIKKVENALENMQDRFFQEKGLSMLSYAIMKRSYVSAYIARRMIERNDNINQIDTHGKRALDYAIMIDDINLSELLARNGAKNTLDFSESVSSIQMYDTLYDKMYIFKDEAIEEAVYQRVKARVLQEYDLSVHERDQHIAFKRMCYVAKLILLRDELRVRTGRPKSLENV